MPEESEMSLRCLVLAPPGATPPPALAHAMARRGLALELCASAHAAMARLAKPDASAPSALIIVEPKRVPLSEPLASAAATYAPQVALWRFAEGDTPRLARWNGSCSAAEVPARISTSPTSRAPALRLVGDLAAPRAPDSGDILDGPADATQSDGLPARNLLTADELHLLLGADDIDAQEERLS